MSRESKDIVGALSPAPLDKLAGARILLTGAAGFLGRHLVETIDEFNSQFPSDPCHLVALDAHANTRVLKASIKHPEFVDFVNHDLSYDIGLTEKFTHVIHAAGKASPYWYQRHPLETINVALRGSLECLRIAARDKARYLFFSSSEVYQTATQVPTPETYIGAVPSMASRSCYDVSKLMGETYAHVYHAKEGVNTGVIRIHNSFGPYLRENDHRILPRLASAIKAGRPLRVYASGKVPLPTRTYCYVANTIYGILLALLDGAPGEVYNVGVDGPEINVVELVKSVQQLGFPATYEIVPPPSVYATEPLRRCPDITKLRELGFSPRVYLNDGLERFLSWALGPEGGYTGVEP